MEKMEKKRGRHWGKRENALEIDGVIFENALSVECEEI